MAPVLNVLLEILRILRFARDYIKRFPGRGAPLLALLSRKLTAWWRFWRGKLGSHGRRKSVKRPFVGTEASSSSVSGGSAVVGGYVVAASYVPPSASRPNLHERTDGQQQQPATVVYPVSTHPPVIDSLSVDHPYGHNPPQSLGTRGVNRSSGNLSAASIQSRASDRFSIITTSRDSLRATHGQPSRLPRGTHRQFGRGPDPSRSRERPTLPSSRPNTPSTRPHTPPIPPRLEIITTNLPSAAHGNGRGTPLVPPSASSSYAHQPLSPPTSNEVRRRQSSTIVVDVQNPSTESLPISPSTTNPPVTEEPLAMESSTAHSSPDSPVVDQHDEPVPGSPTSSNAVTLDYYLPEGRFVQLVNSDQIPRYEKNALMQVEYTILLPHPYISLQTSRGDTL
jgi:hypothetical protein